MERLRRRRFLMLPVPGRYGESRWGEARWGEPAIEIAPPYGGAWVLPGSVGVLAGAGGAGPLAGPGVLGGRALVRGGSAVGRPAGGGARPGPGTGVL